MNRIIMSWAATAALLLALTAAVPAAATVDHTYVSGKGTDTGGCVTPPTACRTFAYALSQTATSGEIIVLDPANYSPVTITNSISIVADGGGPAGIILATGNAITVNAGTAGVVNLRGLTLDGEGTAQSGIVVNSAGSLTISDCFIRHFQNSGILLSGNLNGSILNSVMANNGIGLTVSGSSTFVNANQTFVTIRKSVANDNGAAGFSLGTAGFVTVAFADSVATGNSGPGILINGPSDVFSYGDNEFALNNNHGDVVGGTLLSVGKQ